VKLLAVAALVALCLVGWFVASPPWANDLIGGDEGYYGTMARNVLAGPRWIVSPSLTPLGPAGDKPPLYPLMLAASIAAGGVTETSLRWPTLVFAGLIALACAMLTARLAGWRWGALATVILLVLPWFADASRSAAAEPPLTALGALALVVVAGERVTPKRAALAGALLGLAFLCKLWLVVLIATPVLACVWRRRDPNLARNVIALVVTATLVSASHLALVALARPQDLTHWLAIYFGRSLAGRLGGEEFAPGWAKPPVFYWSEFVHACTLILPLIAVGLYAAWKRRGDPLARALLIWAAGILLLSVFTVKGGGYLYPVMPAYAVLAALGAKSLARVTTKVVPIAIAGMLVTLPPLIARLGGEPVPIGIWAVTWLALLAIVLVARARPGTQPWLAGAFVAAVLALSIVRDVQRLPQPYHTPGYRVLAQVLAPRVARASPATTSYIGPEAPSFMYYMFRTGTYWQTPALAWTPERLAQTQTDTRLKLFVVDTSQSFYGGWPDSAAVEWLEGHATEVTPQFQVALGRPSPLRAFVR
jgi:4-amino-4-deoxy-L-arabinose transferase-like glycosyltransferase